MREGRYLVTITWMGKRLVFTDYWIEPLGWDEWHDDVVAWAELPEPYRGEEHE
ncbi:MAG: hypothetical protein K6A77_11580 [Clostridiales bacterium]|nr:hypothetical protein [Clostridiales bacterium]